MRKVLSFVLVLALVLGSFSMAFASYSDMAGEDSSDAVNVLSSLGVVSGYPDGTYKPDRIVTRAEMAKLIVAALGLEDYATATTSKYSDMSAAPWAQGYVAYGTSLGFISGYPDGTFKPNNTVSYEEAASMIVRALGYTSEFLPGDWPAEWVIKAKTLGIFDDVSATTGGANRGDIAVMLYNALPLGIGYVDADNKWNWNGSNEEDDTMLVRLGAELYDTDGDGGVAAGAAFVLTRAIADDAAVNLNEYIGAYITAYANSDNEIIAVKEMKSTFLKGDFDFTVTYGAMYAFQTTNQFDTAGDDYDVNAVISTTAIKYFVNGQDKSGGFDVVAGTEYKVAAKISGLKMNDIYSISTWEAETAFQYSDGDLDLDNSEFNGYYFAENNRNEVDFDSFELVGVNSLNDIKEDNVVQIYLADPDDTTSDIVKIEVGTKTIVGKVTQISTATDADYTIEGVKYKKLSSMSAPSLADEGTFYLTYGGKLAFFDGDGKADSFAIVLTDTAASQTYGESDVWKVKLLLADGTEKVMTYDSKATTTGGVVFGSDMTKAVKVYDTDKDGEITTLYALTLTPADGKVYKNNVLAGKLIDSGVVVFIYDASETSYEDKFSVGSLSDIVVDEAFATNTLFYGDNDGNGKIDVIFATTEATDYTNTYGIYVSYVNALNEDDDIVKYVTALVNGASTSKYTDGDVTVLTDKATIYKFTYDGDIITNMVIAGLTSGAVSVDEIAYLTTAGFTTVKAVASGNLIDVDGYGYELIAGANAYKATFKDDGTFDKYVVGSISDIKADDKVMLFHADPDSDNWDMVFYVKKVDAGKSGVSAAVIN